MVRRNPKLVIETTTGHKYAFVGYHSNAVCRRILAPYHYYFAKVVKKLWFGFVILAASEYRDIGDFSVPKEAAND